MLIAFSGLPGTGKSTVARAVAASLQATYVRIDVIEQTLVNALGTGFQVGATGYAVANSIAESNLTLGGVVIADCVNPVQQSRMGWRAIAVRSCVGILEVEVICSDLEEHRRRIEERQADISGHHLPSWKTVEQLRYEPWIEPRLVLDTAFLSAEQAAAIVVRSRG